MRLTSYFSALDMLTLPLVSLSKPVGPVMSWVSLLTLIVLRPELVSGPHATHFIFKEQFWRSLS